MHLAGRDIYTTAELQRREAAFFDSLAARQDLSVRRKRIESDTPFGNMSPASSRYVCEFLGPLEGKKALDIGCGNGFTTVLLAKKGCRISSIDISESLVGVARQSVRAYGVESRIDAIRCMAVEGMDFPDACFDLVWGGDILHHVKLEEAIPEIVRVMKPGAVGVFVENFATNPAFMFLRNYVAGHFGIPKVGNETEYPLRGYELKFIAGHFRFFELRGDVMFGRMHEYLFTSDRLNRTVQAVDAFLFGSFPWLSRAAYHGIITVRK